MGFVKVTRLSLGTALAAMLLFAGNSVQAHDYPNRPVTLIVPFAAGGFTDISARVYAESLSKKLGQPVVVDNRPGANGTTGGGMVANAAADGYTLLWSGASLLAMAPLVYTNLSYDIKTAYQPISRFVAHPNLFAVNAALPVNTAEEFISYAREHPTELNYGSAGIASIHHLSGELFKHHAKFEMEHIPYQGIAPVITDLLAGTINATFIAYPQSIPYSQDPAIKFLFITSPEESDKFPGVPTAAAIGFPELEVSASWYGVLAPKGLPEDILAKLSEASREIAQSDETARFAADSGVTPIVDTPETFAETIRSDYETWKSLVESANLELAQ